jgi:hypothetical protein
MQKLTKHYANTLITMNYMRKFDFEFDSDDLQLKRMKTIYLY